MKPLMTAPTDLDWQIARGFVEENWPAIAATAWKDFQKRGRGMVIYNADKQPEEPGRSGLLFHKVRYLTDLSSGQAYFRQFGINLRQLVASYDPKLSAVVFITRAYNDLDRLSRRVIGKEETEWKEKSPIVTVAVYSFLPSPPLCHGMGTN